ncbi:MAG: hypothetical protein J1E62_11360 [Lachnospiraceae bacterium]|nr:hypothetical protein [Lachnospiraceae bacterium]
MEQRILQYREYLLGICEKDYSDDERRQLCEKVLTQISFFQHERLIHLIVTITFALLTVIVFAVCAVAPTIPFLCLGVLLMVLLFPYIRHYYILENSVQTMYRCYDKLCLEEFHEIPKKQRKKGGAI